MENERKKGYAFAAVAAVSYGLNPLFTLPMYDAGMSADAVLFYRYLTAAVLLGGLMLLRRQSFSLRVKQVAPLAMMGILVALSSLFLFQSYDRMDAGIASTILFVYPVMVAVIMTIFFRERLSKLTMLSILLSLLGIALLYKGEDGATLNLLGVVLVFLSSLCYAVYIVGVNRSSLREMPAEKLTFYILLFGIVLFIARLALANGWQAVPEAGLWINVLGLALFPTVVSFVAMAAAIRRIGSTPTAILGALEPVTALFFGVVVFGELLTVRIVIGVALILAAVMLIIAGRPLLHRIPLLRRIPLLLHLRR